MSWKDNPQFIATWDTVNNGLIENFNGKGKAWWICDECECKTTKESRKYRMTISDRLRGRGCPYCYHKVCECGCNSVYELNPELRKEWDCESNGDMKLYRPTSRKKFWWICSKCICETTKMSRRWQRTLNDRVNKKSGCPYCYHKVCECGCNSVYQSNPELREEWDKEKNGSMKTYTTSSGQKVGWICKKWCIKTGEKHRWESVISCRTNKNRLQGCPICSGRVRCSCGCNSLYELFPRLRDEWDDVNGDMKTYAPYSKINVWWICRKNNSHRWQACPGNRTSNETGCPFCRRSMMEETMTNVLEELEIEFTQQETEQINGRALRFDFYLPDYNLYIECQGCQHFHSDYHFNEQSGGKIFPDLVRRDLSKVIFTYEKGASFLSISYIVSLKQHQSILLDTINKLEQGNFPICRLYYDEHSFWELCKGQKYYPQLPITPIPEIVSIYEQQFKMI